MNQLGKINYIDLPCRDLAATKAFFNQAFGWGFVDYGPDPMAITDANIESGRRLHFIEPGGNEYAVWSER